MNKAKITVPLIDLPGQYVKIRKDIDAAIEEVVRTQYFVMGSAVSSLEKNVAAYCGTKYGVGVNSGTDALFLSLVAAGIKQGDEVITVPFTFIATAEAISNAGAAPVFVDIDRDTFNMDVSGLEKRITKKTKAIMPVHLYGQCADMDAICAVAHKYGLVVIEDTAQAIGALYNGRKAGSIGDAGCLSFFPSKNLGGFGDGGMVVTNDAAFAEKLRSLRVHGSLKTYYHDAIGYNSRLDNLQAAVLDVKLKYLDGWLKARQDNAEYLNAAFKGIPGIETPKVPSGNTHTYHQYMVRVGKDVRDKFVEFLGENGIESRVYYPVPLHMQACYAFLGYKPGDFPVSRDASQRVAALPVHPELTSEQKERVTAAVKKFFG